MKHETLKNRGFTLAELLVALFVFVTVILMVMNITFSLIKSQRKIFAMQNIQESGRFILEFVTKELRTSKIETVAGLQSDLQIINDDSEEVTYQFSGNRLYRNGQPISPSNVSLTGFFNIQKYDPPFRAVVTILMKLDYGDAVKSEEQTNLFVQSSIVSRVFTP